jgi:phosphorylcholine metabolism protein LicD
MINEQVLPYLNKITTSLTSNNIKYWLDGGTLLGLYREGSLIAWDGDLDISLTPDMNIPSLRKQIIDIMNKNKCVLTREAPTKFKFKIIDIAVAIDFWFFKLINSKQYYNRAFGVPFYFDKSSLDNLKVLTIKDYNFYIPNNTEDYLYEIYGKNWRIPNPNFKKPDDYKNYKK